MDEKLTAVIDEDVAAIAACDLPWEALAGCTVVVTGAAGFIGGYLVRTLAALHRLGRISRAVEIVAMVRDAERARARFGNLVGTPHFRLVEWDLCTLSVPELGPIHYVLHAASQASPRYYGQDPVGTLLPNTIGTAALLEALRRSPDARGLLFVSSSEVYGAVSSTGSLDETQYGIVDPATLRACYAEGKRMGETMCVAWQRQHGIPCFIARPFHTYGPGLRPDDGRVFADFAFNVVRGENIVMRSAGTARRAFCYASDAISGLFTVLLKGSAGVPYNVANPSGELSVAELAELLIALFPDRGLHVQRQLLTGDSAYVPSTYDRLIPDVSRLAALGWRAAVSPRDGFERMILAHSP